jgi:hypothetical protein
LLSFIGNSNKTHNWSCVEEFPEACSHCKPRTGLIEAENFKRVRGYIKVMRPDCVAGLWASLSFTYIILEVFETDSIMKPVF